MELHDAVTYRSHKERLVQLWQHIDTEVQNPEGPYSFVFIHFSL